MNASTPQAVLKEYLETFTDAERHRFYVDLAPFRLEAYATVQETIDFLTQLLVLDERGWDEYRLIAVSSYQKKPVPLQHLHTGLLLETLKPTSEFLIQMPKKIHPQFIQKIRGYLSSL